MKLLVMYIVLILTIFNFSNDVNNLPLNVKDSILFLEGYPDAIGGYTRGFNNITLFNLNTKKSITFGDNYDYITSVDYYSDSSVIYSGYRSEYVDLLGTGPELSIYEYVLNQDKRKMLYDLMDDRVFSIEDLQHINNNKVIFSFTNSIFILDKNFKDVKEMTEGLIDDLSTSDNMDIAWSEELGSLETEYEYMLYINKRKKNNEPIMIYKSKPMKNIKILNWINSNLYFYSDSTLYQYSLTVNKLDVLTTIPADSIYIKELKINSKMEVYLIGSDKIYHHNNIYKYNIDERKLTKITNSRSSKSNLRICF